MIGLMTSYSVPPPRVVLPEALSGSSWRACAEAASTALASAGSELIVECAELRVIDDHGIAMLIGLAHYSARRQVRVVLTNPPAALRSRLELNGMAWFFAWRPLVETDSTEPSGTILRS